MTPELNSQIAVWRQKALEGTLTEAEMRDAIAVLRQGRVGAAIASEKSRKSKVKSAVPIADDLLSEMEGL